MSVYRKIEKLVNKKAYEGLSEYTIVHLNEDGKIEEWNDSAIRILGYNSKEVKGCSFKIFFNDSENEAHIFRKLIDKAIKFGKTSSENVLVKKDHSTFNANILINSIYDEERKVIGFSVIVGDVNYSQNNSGKRRSIHHQNGSNESLKHLEELTKDFEKVTTAISHDLKAPLRAIEGYLRIFNEDHSRSVDEEGKRILKTVQANSKKMHGMIENLVAYSRVSTRKLAYSHINMKELVENILQEYKLAPQNVEKHGEINIQVGRLPSIKGDHSLINLAFIHLISNAVKFTATNDKPVIRISAEIKKENAIFIIEDNGIGIDMQYSKDLFEVFQKLHSNPEIEGSGIGLAIVKNIVSKHKGKIWVESAPDKGSRFYVSLPLTN